MLRLPQNNKVKPAAVYARITGDSYRTEISLKSRMSINNWNEVKGSAKRETTRNRIIEQIHGTGAFIDF